MRISRELMWMEMAHVVARRSTCFRLNVGAIIVTSNRILSMGYNGQEPGAEHCMEMCEPGQCNTIHAEANAIEHARGSNRARPWHIYCTDSPCMDCAILIHRAGIAHVYYRTPYRDLAPLGYIAARGVQVSRITPAGQVIPHETARLASRRGRDAAQA